MTGTQREVIQSNLNNEKKVIRELKQVYNQASKDVESKISELNARTDMQNLQSIVYQRQYQEALQNQLNGILDSMQTEEFTTISGYLEECYTNGYVGSMYDIASQGIPVITPINQDQVVRALMTDSNLSTSMYNRLGEDVNYLKNSIRAELSRGIAQGDSWLDMAARIANGMNSPFDTALNNSIRIARTEGNRIQNEAQLDAMQEAKDAGADVVKQWCATLDGDTREEHQELDGQIREIDDEFEVAGYSAMAPGEFGEPEMDINCRCCMLQRARWGLDADELKELEERAEFYGLDKTDDFEDFKEKYLDATAEIQHEAEVVETAAASSIADVQNFDELTNYLQDNYNISVDPSVRNLDFGMVKDTMSGMESMFVQYPELATNITSIGTKKSGCMCCSGSEIFFNPAYYGSENAKITASIEQSTASGWWPSNTSVGSIGVHETAHAVERLLVDMNPEYEYGVQKVIAWNESTQSKAIVSQAVKNIKKTDYGKGKVQAELMKSVSGYGATSKQECFAESFADVYANGDNANPLSKEITRLAGERYATLKGGTGS